MSIVATICAALAEYAVEPGGQTSIGLTASAVGMLSWAWLRRPGDKAVGRRG